MKIISYQTQLEMDLAAELRAAGATWETIAGQLDRHPNHVSRWPRVYSKEWDGMLILAGQRLSRRGDEPWRATLRELLRSPNPKVRVSAARQYTEQLRRERAEGKSGSLLDAVMLVEAVDKMTDEELDEMMNSFMSKMSADDKPV